MRPWCKRSNIAKVSKLLDSDTSECHLNRLLQWSGTFSRKLEVSSWPRISTMLDHAKIEEAYSVRNRGIDRYTQTVRNRGQKRDSKPAEIFENTRRFAAYFLTGSPPPSPQLQDSAVGAFNGLTLVLPSS